MERFPQTPRNYSTKMALRYRLRMALQYLRQRSQPTGICQTNLVPIYTERTTTNRKISPERRLLTRTRQDTGENLAYVGVQQ